MSVMEKIKGMFGSGKDKPAEAGDAATTAPATAADTTDTTDEAAAPTTVEGAPDKDASN